MADEKFMRIAITEARFGIDRGHGGPFGAVIARGNEVLAIAHNTVLRDNDPVQHAEIRAISLAAKKLGVYDLSGCEIYSTTEPCPMCFSAIHWARIDRLIYGTRIEAVRELGFNELSISAAKMREMGSSPVIIEARFMWNECKGLLEHWSTLPDKKVY